jgi:trimethylamine--corrinoid protein Co-methyltransferase
VGHEKTLTAMIPALAGANMIYGLGMLESGITFDYGQLVLDCEIARMVNFTVHGIEVSDETLAVDVIKEIGPGRDFLMHPHTYDGMRGQSRPEIIDRRVRAAWQEAGATTAYERALEKARWILANHQPDPLPPEVIDRIREIVTETEKEFGVTAI